MSNTNDRTPPTMPDTKTLVEDLGALYPTFAYGSLEEDPSTETLPEKAELDPEVLDEEIFVHLVALR